MLRSTANIAGIGKLILGSGSVLSIQGDKTDAEALLSYLGATKLLVWDGASLQTITSSNQSDLLAPVFSSGFTSFSLKQNPPVGSFESWILQFKETIPLELREPDDDPDGDSFKNFEEYLFGTQADKASASLTEMIAGIDKMTLVWNERVGVTYVLQESATLADNPWPTSSIVPVDSPQQNDVPEGYTRRQATLHAGADKKFLRVKAVQ